MRTVRDLDRVTFVSAKTIRADERTNWETWLTGHATAHDGGLWRLLDPGPAGRPGAGHSHVIHLPGGRTDHFDEATANARRDGRAAGHAEIRRDEWSRAGDGIARESDGEVTGLIVAEVLCIDPTRVDEWDEWYDTQHLPDMMASGAFAAGSRWRRTDARTGSANHLTIYEIAGGSVDEAVERSAAVMPNLIAQGRKHECHAGGLTWALDAVG
ncbi:MAG: hypothetical protein R2707_18605 [Acidimicrobiales bacterium]